MQTGATVGEWRSKLKTILSRNEFDGDHPNKYSGYVYDAVWLYALALDKLIKQNKSYIQDIHRSVFFYCFWTGKMQLFNDIFWFLFSERSVNEFVNIISTMDFQGVTGRINFHNGNSRLSNIKVLFNFFYLLITSLLFKKNLQKLGLISWKMKWFCWQKPTEYHDIVKMDLCY